MSLDDYIKVLQYYNIERPDNIYKIKKQANRCMYYKMCKTDSSNSKYKKVLFILLIRKYSSHNKKNIKSHTMKMKINMLNNKTRIRSPISYLCT